MRGGARPRFQHLSALRCVIGSEQPKCCHDAMRCRWADTDQELQEAEPGDHVMRVVGQPKSGKHVLDVPRLDKAHPAVLDVRNPPRSQLELEYGLVG